jgi:hypothetical protein
MYFDDALVATVPIAMRSMRVWLQAHTHYRQEGTVLGEFDNLAVTGTERR